MTAKELIDEFKEASGRYDLTDVEILRYINRGSRLLDRRSLHTTLSRAHHSVDPGEFVAAIDPDLRSLKSVWTTTATKRSKLESISLDEMRELYKERPVVISNGDITHYALTTMTIGKGGQVGGLNPSSEIFIQWTDDLLFNNSAGYVGLLLYPPPAEKTVVEVIGVYYTPAIKDEIGSDSNWWSVNHSNLLIQAALITLDSNYRNTSGAKENFALIDEELKEIYFDSIESSLSNSMCMRG